MSTLIAITYPDVNEAERVLTTLGQLQNEFVLDLEDAVYVTKDTEGKVKLHQSVNSTKAGATGGALLGGFMGLVLGTFVLMPIAGAAIGAGIGAGTGALSGRWSEYGIDENFMKQLGEKLTPNTSAIIVLVRKSTPDKVLPVVSKYGGTILQTSLPDDLEAKLGAALAQGAAQQSSPSAGASTSA